MYLQQGSPGSTLSPLIRSSFLDAALKPQLCNAKQSRRIADLSLRHNIDADTGNVQAEITALDVMATPEGYRDFRIAIVDLLGAKGEEVFEGGLAEPALAFLAKHVLYEADDTLVSTVLDLCDYESRGRLDISQVYLLFLLLCAIESKQLLEFFHRFGRPVFEMLSMKQAMVHFDRTVNFCSLVFDKSAVELGRSMQRLGLDRQIPLSYADFELFLYDITKTELKTRDAEPRIFIYECDPQHKIARFYEQKKPRMADKSGGTSGGSSAQAILKCTLI